MVWQFEQGPEIAALTVTVTNGKQRRKARNWRIFEGNLLLFLDELLR